MSFSTYVTAVGSVDGPTLSKRHVTATTPTTKLLDARVSLEDDRERETRKNDSFDANPSSTRCSTPRAARRRRKRAAMDHREEGSSSEAPWIWE